MLNFLYKECPKEKVPKIIDPAEIKITVDEIPVTLTLFDTYGIEDFDKLRPLSYPKTDVFIICSSVIYLGSFGDIVHKWTPEIKHYCPKAKIIIVATKTELRNDPTTLQRMAERGIEPVSYEHGLSIQKQIGAEKYLECSSYNQENISLVFEEAVRTVLQGKQKDSKKSCLVF